MYLLYAAALVLIRVFASYDSRCQRGRYMRIDNRVFQKLLLEKRAFWEDGDRLEKDRNKITVPGVIFYVCALFVLAANVVLRCLVPRIPATPWEMDSEKLYVYAETVNERLCVALIWFFLLAALAYMMIEILAHAKSVEKIWLRVTAYAVAVGVLIVIVFMAAELIFVDGLLSF